MLWRIYSHWLELSLVAKVLTAANVLWAAGMLYGIVNYESTCEGAACGWGIIFGGGTWILGQLVLLLILAVVTAFRVRKPR